MTRLPASWKCSTACRSTVMPEPYEEGARDPSCIAVRPPPPSRSGSLKQHADCPRLVTLSSRPGPGRTKPGCPSARCAVGSPASPPRACAVSSSSRPRRRRTGAAFRQRSGGEIVELRAGTRCSARARSPRSADSASTARSTTTCSSRCCSPSRHGELSPQYYSGLQTSRSLAPTVGAGKAPPASPTRLPAPANFSENRLSPSYSGAPRKGRGDVTRRGRRGGGRRRGNRRGG